LLVVRVFVLCVKAGGETKICEFDVASAIKKDVVRFDVTLTGSAAISGSGKQWVIFSELLMTYLGQDWESGMCWGNEKEEYLFISFKKGR